MVRYTDKNGNEIILGTELGKGGEASVYKIKGKSNLVAKIYNTEHSVDRQKLEKLKMMCNLFDNEIAKYYAWPQDILYSRNKAVGFIMENINNSRTKAQTSKYQLFVNFYGWKSRRKDFPNAEYKFMVHAAKNLAVAVKTLHEKDIVIGDINESNVFVNNTDTTIKLLDCDSYQIGNFLCGVGKPEYTAPELPSKLGGERRTKNHDNFALAILIFLILVGKHPYTGLGAPLDQIRQSITQGLYCYGKDAKKKNISAQYPFSEVFNSLNEKIKELFEQAFCSTNRPTANDWILALEKYENELTNCSNNDNHWYNPEYKSCIWCDLEKNGFYAFGSNPVKTTKTQHKYDRQTPYKANSTAVKSKNKQNKIANTYNPSIVNSVLYHTQVAQKPNKKELWVAVSVVIALILGQIFLKTNNNNIKKVNNIQTQSSETYQDYDKPQDTYIDNKEDLQIYEEEQTAQENSSSQYNNPVEPQNTNITQTDLNKYMNTLLSAIYKRWAATENDKNKQIYAKFAINKSGCISNVDVYNAVNHVSIKYSDGYELVAAINGVSCNYPFPQGFNKEALWVEFSLPGFEYRFSYADYSNTLNSNNNLPVAKTAPQQTSAMQIPVPKTTAPSLVRNDGRPAPSLSGTSKETNANSKTKPSSNKAETKQKPTRPKTELEKSTDYFFE